MVIMKIGVISNLYPPIARGGAEQVAWRTVQEFLRQGHEVFVISTCPRAGISSFFPRLTERSGEAVYRFFPLNVYHMLHARGHGFFLRMLWHVIDLLCPTSGQAVRTVIEEERPDVIVAHNMKGFGLQTARELRRLKMPHVHVLHDVQLSVPSGLLIAGKEHAFLNAPMFRIPYEYVVRCVFGSPDVVVSPSAFLADFYRSRGFFPKSRSEVLPNPAPNQDMRGTRLERGGPLRILFAGQLEPHKGVELLKRVLARTDLSFELHIAGEGSLSDELAEWAERDRRITHHGFVSLNNLFKILTLCDVTVVPSLCYENSPTVIYESFQAGVPVIASRIGGVGELVRDGENGFLVAPGDESALEDALKRFLASREAFRAKEQAIRAGMEPYAIATYTRKFETLLEAAIERKAAAKALR